MRISSLHLYGINPKDFIGVPYDEVLKIKADALMDKKRKLSKKLNKMNLNKNVTYDEISSISSEIQFINKALLFNVGELDEMELPYKSVI